MTVRELKQKLEGLPDDMEVILQKDLKGNSFFPLAGTDPHAIYITDSTWESYVYDSRWSSIEAGLYEDEWEEMKQKPRALILFPIN